MLAAGAVSTLMAATLVAGAAQAQTAGAPIGTPTQQGSWGQGGWQAGAPGATVAPQPGYAAQTAWHDSPRGDFHRTRPGGKMPRPYLDPMYAVSDWQGWGLSQPGPGMHWLRYYNDAVLVDSRGRVVDTRYDFDWNHPRGYAGGPAYGAGPGYPPPGYGAPGYAPGTTTYRAGPNTTVTTSVVAAPPPVVVAGPAPGYGYGGGYYAGGASVVSVTPGVVVTTTTTTTDYETVYKSAGVKRAYKRRAYRPSRPRCVRAPTCPVLGS